MSSAHTKPRFQSPILFLALVFFLLASPFVSGLSQTILNLVGLAVLGLVGAYILASSRTAFVVFCASAVLMIVFESIDAHPTETGLAVSVVGVIFTITTFGLLLYFLLHYSLWAPDVRKRDRLLAGISGYLIFAILCASIYYLLELLSPRSFVDARDEVISRFDLIYLSLVTISTLGYGDILPQTAGARMLCGMEAVFGTLYLAVFISALVGMKDGQRPTSRP